jgi:GT2 family glycosyltransferase
MIGSPPSRPAAAALLTMTEADGIVVLGGGSEADLPSRVAITLRAGSGVGAVVPVVARRGPDPLGSGSAESLTRRERTDTDLAAIAIAPHVLRGLRIDPEIDDPTAVARAVVRHVRSQGLRVLADPEWTVERAVFDIPTAAAVTVRSSDVLVVTGFLSDAPAQVEDQLVFDLVRSISEQMTDGSLTVLLTDGFRSGRQVDRLRANGVDVVVPPVDTDRWFRARVGRFSHAILTPSGLQSAIWNRLLLTQPQAARILYLSSLPFREVNALAPLTPAPERASLEAVRSVVEARTVEAAARADAVWCDVDADARWARGVLPGMPVSVIGSGIASCADPLPLGDRSGIMLLGDVGHDMIKANEDAAVAALDQLIPLLRDRHPDLPVTVISDMPTPFLRHAVVSRSALFAAGSDARTVACRSRLIIDYHTYGTGGEASIRLALETATPFVAHPAAKGGLDLGALGEISLFGAPADLSFRARALLEDDRRWLGVRAMIDDLVRDRYGAQQRSVALRNALASVGIVASMPAGRWLDDSGTKDVGAPHRPVQVPLRPEGTAVPPPLPGIVSESHDERYQLWAKRYGPTDQVLDGLRAAVAGLTYQPLISVLVPVFNTSANGLTDAIESVRNQVYERWQLCLVDDGSTRSETLATLGRFGDDPRIKILHLEKNVGIADATNAALQLADGEYVAFLDHDDLLKPHALAQVARWLDADPALDMVYSDEDKIDEAGMLVQPRIKPDWSPNEMMSRNYVSHLTVVRRSLVSELGGLRAGFDGSQDYDLVLRVMERTDRIAHVPEPLYSWRLVTGSVSAEKDAKPYALDAAKRALHEATVRRGHPARVEDTAISGIYRTRYHLFGQPRVAIIIPTKDRLHLLEKCVKSIIERSTYKNYEILVVDNETTDGPTLAYLSQFPGRVLRYNHPFNYARMINAAARSLDCDAFIFLNNDTEVITPGWIEELLELGMRREVGAVGARLYYEDGRIQHEGIIIGQGAWAQNVDHGTYWAMGEIVRDTSAVTGACTMMRSSVYWRIGGNDERLRVAYNDVDICLRAHQAGYDVVYTPHAELYHYEGASRAGMEHHEDGPQFGIRWRPSEGVDQYHSQMFEPVGSRFRIRV